MKIKKILKTKLKKFSYRDTFIQIINRLILYWGWSICLYLTLWGINKFFPLPFLGKDFFLLISLISVGLAISITFLRRKTLFEIACFIDKKSELKERVSTAWEFSLKKKENIFTPFLVKDTLSELQEIKTSHVFPYYPPSQVMYLLYTLIVIFLFLSLSYFPSLNMEKRRTYLYQEANILKALSEELSEEGKRENLKSVTLLVPRVKELSEKTSEGKIGPEELLKAYDYLQEEIEARIQEKKRELLQELNSLLQKEKQGSSLQRKIQEAMEAIKKGEYEKARKLLEEFPLPGEKKELRELESLSKAKKDFEKSYERMSNQLKKDEARKESFPEIAQETSEKEKALFEEIKSLGGISPYSSSPSKEKEEKEVFLEPKKEGELSKVKGQGEDSLLMSLIENLFLPDSSIGLKEREAFSSYQKLMINRLFEEKIPGTYKERVKEYFTSLEPK